MSVLVMGERSEALLELLRARNVEATAVEALVSDVLDGATVVVLAAEHGRPLPDAAWDVLAAGAVLVAPRAKPGYGLEPGIDHLSGGSDRELADMAALAAAFPAALEPVVAMGRLMAQSRTALT